MSPAPTPPGAPAAPITPADIEARFRALQGEVEAVEAETRDYLTIAIAAVAVTVVLGAYLIGRRRGKKRRTVLEIRRV
jgi:hypothetical protein